MPAKKTQVIAAPKDAQNAVDTGLKQLERIQRATVVTIKDDVGYATAGEALRQVKALIEQAEDERTNIVKPINDGVKRINEFFKKLTAPAKAYEAELKIGLVHYQDTKRQLEMEKAEKEAKRLEKRSPEAAADLRQAAAERAVVPAVEGVGLRKTWTYEIEDEAAIPREFLMVDEKKLRAYAVAMKDSAKVAGVRFKEVTGIAASAS